MLKPLTIYKDTNTIQSLIFMTGSSIQKKQDLREVLKNEDFIVLIFLILMF
jgi:hypothetical protein